METAHAQLQCLAEDSVQFRLLDALLSHAPTAEGADVVARDIIAASAEPDGLQHLAEFYERGLLLPMRAGGRTPQVSFHPSRDPQILSEASEIAVDLDTAKREPSTLKKYALHRDGYRCVATHAWDLRSLLAYPAVMDKFDPSQNRATTTEAAHILPFSLMSADTNAQLFGKCTIRTVIESFTNINFNELNGENINSLENVITLHTALHQLFGSLYIWFEPSPGRSNTYNIRTAYPYLLGVEDGAEVTFTSPDPEVLPLPDPRYLAFHAAVAKVVHAAGMAQRLDGILGKYEKVRVLSDESGAEYLDGLLRIFQRNTIAPMENQPHDAS